MPVKTESDFVVNTGVNFIKSFGIEFEFNQRGICSNGGCTWTVQRLCG